MRLRVEAGNAAVGVADGLIVAPDGLFDLEISVPGGILQPGLINPHDHLHRNHYGRLGAPPYPNAYAWGRDIHNRYLGLIALARSLPRRDALLRGAWKNLFAGVTTVVHHDPWEPNFESDFPLRVVRLRTVHSLGFGTGLGSLDDGSSPYSIHLAEGVDALSAYEVREMDRLGLLTERLLAVHVVGADAAGVQRLRDSGAALVWCPTSNHFLFGRTAPPELLAPGMDVLVGSDSLLTGDGTLLDELRAARRLELVSDERLRQSVGVLAARRLALPEPSLEIGAPADLVVMRRELLEAGTDDVALVVADGAARVIDPALLPDHSPLRERGRIVRMMGTTRWTDQRPVSGLVAIPSH